MHDKICARDQVLWPPDDSNGDYRMELPQPRVYTVNDFQQWAQRDELVLQPKFQRRLIWHNKARSFLIDTIVNNFPIPAIYVREILDTSRRRTVREVVDGQQRLRTVLD